MQESNSTTGTAVHRSGATLAGMIRLARPKDWVKNVFVLVPLPFAMAASLHHEGVPYEFSPWVFLLGLLGFSVINSAVYTLNDLFDAEADRQHPRKRLRPIASGQISAAVAVAQFVILLLAGMTLTIATGRPVAVAVVLVYLIVNIAYSLGVKNVALLDVFVLASGFVIRVLLGCALVAVMASPWLLLCTSALAFFLGFIKRRADLTAGLDCNHRRSLRGYTQAFLDQAITICAGVALLAYALYSIESNVFVSGREMASMPLVAYGILNYLRLADKNNTGGSPVEIAYTSRSSQLCAVGWIVAVTWSLGLW